MKIMISQPMNGKAEEQIRKERSELVKELEKQGHEVLDTIYTDEVPEGYDARIYYLSKAIRAIGKADAIVFMKGWEQARGCRIENQVALAYGKFIKIL